MSAPRGRQRPLSVAHLDWTSPVKRAVLIMAPIVSEASPPGSPGFARKQRQLRNCMRAMETNLSDAEIECDVSEQSGGRPKTLRKGNANPKATKRVQLIRILRAPTGVGVAALCRKFGWQAQTTRAALSRLRTAEFEIRRKQPSSGKPARYRLISSPGSEGRADAS